MTQHPLRVLVVEDSPTARAFLVALLMSDPALTVVGEAADGIEAVELTQRLRPDVITMDVHMPRMDGLEATREIMSSVPTPIVVVTANTPGDVELSLDVIAAGALMVLEKPAFRPDGTAADSNRAAFQQQRERLLAMVKAMAHVKLVRRWSAGRTSPRSTAILATKTRRSPSAVQAVAIAASTGGPAAVQRLLGGLPSDFCAPVLLVQHIARGFTPGLVHWLEQSVGLAVRQAEHGEPLRGGTVYVAPDDRHLGADHERRVVLADTDPIQGFRPSATHLFESVGRAFGARAVGVILTGMGNDGVAGLKTLHGRGGTVLAQDEASAVVYGMPREAALAGVVNTIGSVDELAGHLCRLVASEKSQ